MSLRREESPLSDSKMDISDATTSLDSAGISPVAIENEAETNAQALSNQNDHAPLVRFVNEMHESEAQQAGVDSCLDNRIQTTTQQRSNIARTLANIHPLMLPHSTEAESEQINGTAANAKEFSTATPCLNFPDVVPHNERLPAQKATSNVVAMRNTINSLRAKNAAAVATAMPNNNITRLRTHSPDLLSESDADVSQYQAAVEASFQSVALVPTNKANASSAGKQRHARVNGKTAVEGAEDISSLDSISNHSFDEDEDIEHNLASLSPSSSLIEGLDEDDDDDDDCEGPELVPDFDEYELAGYNTPTPNVRSLANTAEELPQYTAAEECRDARNWQKVTLPDGRTREIDMRVIEPYKRVLSHGGYLKAGGQNAIVIFCACHLPDRSRPDYNYVMDNLFLYVVRTLEQLVTEDYILIYLHGGTSRRNVPPFPWLKKYYQLLDRRLRKSLKNMYLVHPTFWIKSIVWMARPFVSAKFWRKVIYVKSLAELSTHVIVEKAAIPDKVKQYDAKHG